MAEENTQPQKLQALEFTSVGFEKTGEASLYTLYKNGFKARCPHKHDELNQPLKGFALKDEDVINLQFPTCNSKCPLFKIEPKNTIPHPVKENMVLTEAHVLTLCGCAPVKHVVYMEAHIAKPEAGLKKV